MVSKYRKGRIMMFAIGFIIFCILLWWVAKNTVKAGRFLDKIITRAVQDRAYSTIRIKRDHDELEKLEDTKNKIKSIKRECDKDYSTKVKNEIEEMTKGSTL